jgi:hypothetical protein
MKTTKIINQCIYSTSSTTSQIPTPALRVLLLLLFLLLLLLLLLPLLPLLLGACS